jgi:hypothetical protein
VASAAAGAARDAGEEEDCREQSAEELGGHRRCRRRM